MTADRSGDLVITDGITIPDGAPRILFAHDPDAPHCGLRDTLAALSIAAACGNRLASELVIFVQVVAERDDTLSAAGSVNTLLLLLIVVLLLALLDDGLFS